jgi:hypothetical protein
LFDVCSRNYLNPQNHDLFKTIKLNRGKINMRKNKIKLICLVCIISITFGSVSVFAITDISSNNVEQEPSLFSVRADRSTEKYEVDVSIDHLGSENSVEEYGFTLGEYTDSSYDNGGRDSFGIPTGCEETCWTCPDIYTCGNQDTCQHTCPWTCEGHTCNGQQTCGHAHTCHGSTCDWKCKMLDFILGALGSHTNSPTIWPCTCSQCY